MFYFKFLLFFHSLSLSLSLSLLLYLFGCIVQWSLGNCQSSVKSFFQQYNLVTRQCQTSIFSFDQHQRATEKPHPDTEDTSIIYQQSIAYGCPIADTDMIGSCMYKSQELQFGVHSALSDNFIIITACLACLLAATNRSVVSYCGATTDRCHHNNHHHHHRVDSIDFYFGARVICPF